MSIRRKGDRRSSYFEEAVGADDLPKKKKINTYEAHKARIFGMDSAQAGSYLVQPRLLNRRSLFKSQMNTVHEAIRDAQTQGQYLADLIEAKSTLQVIAEDLKSVLRTVKRLTRPDIRAIKRFVSRSGKTARKNMDKVPANWLKFNFVYLTTSASIRDFAEIMDNPFSAVTFYKSAKDTMPSWYWQTSAHSNLNTYYAKGDIRISNAAQNTVAALGLTDVIGTTWELIPWSWAIDYFVNVGSWLGNLPGRFNGLIYENWYTGYRCNWFHVFMYQEWDPQTRRWVKKYYDVKSDGYYRAPGFPGTDIQLEFQLGPSLRQSTYLMSAIALTLKGKFK